MVSTGTPYCKGDASKRLRLSFAAASLCDPALAFADEDLGERAVRKSRNAGRVVQAVAFETERFRRPAVGKALALGHRTSPISMTRYPDHRDARTRSPRDFRR